MNIDFKDVNLKMWGTGQNSSLADDMLPLSQLSEKQVLVALKSSFIFANQDVLALKAAGSPKLALAIDKWLAAKAKEENRLAGISTFEEAFWNQGITLVAGVDEVGRGPIAGPVVAAAVILPPGFSLYGVNDSKKLSENKRLKLEEVIKARAIAWAIGAVGVVKIDRHNILEASKMAMSKAIRLLPIRPEQVLIDAVHLNDLAIPQTSIIQGDAKSTSIGAASILAKCHRDRMMKAYAKIYPSYGFEKHAGYPTPNHKAVVFKEGYSKIHRHSFVLKPPKNQAK